MRIIAGKYKGKLIKPPASFSARPTTDFAREGIFNIMNNHYNLDEINFLDLFTGTGAITFEMISRGTSRITAVDIQPKYVSFVEKEAALLNATGVKVFNSDSVSFIQRIHEQFNIIFADPPYDTEYYSDIYDAVFEHNLLRPGGLLIFEHNKTHNFSQKKYFLEHRNYGSVNFTIFEMPIE